MRAPVGKPFVPLCGGKSGVEIRVRISAREKMRMVAAVLDEDKDEAFAVVKLLVERMETESRAGMRPHWDRHRP